MKTRIMPLILRTALLVLPFAAAPGIAQEITVTLVSSDSPSIDGQMVAFTAAVPASAVQTSYGQAYIIFKDGATILSTNLLNSSGVATFSIASLSVGSHSITATYVAPQGLEVVSEPLNQAVNAQALRFKSFEVLADRTVKIGGGGAAGRAYLIQAKDHLGEGAWTTVATVTADDKGFFSANDADAPNRPSRFYRLVSAE